MVNVVRKYILGWVNVITSRRIKGLIAGPLEESVGGGSVVLGWLCGRVLQIYGHRVDTTSD